LTFTPLIRIGGLKIKSIIRRIECEEAIEILKKGKFQIAPGSGSPEKWDSMTMSLFMIHTSWRWTKIGKSSSLGNF
jgi:hypothetical protein